MNAYSKTALAAAICTALSAGQAGAATFNVANTNDSGAGSLRDALSQAGANAEADVIDLSTISGQTISLTTGQLEIDDDDVTINGAGVTLDAGGNSRVLATNYADVTLNNLTITGGIAQSAGVPIRGITLQRPGGGILAIRGNLDVNDSEISGNSADLGGGVFFDSDYGSLSVTDSIVSSNSAAYAGGGIYGGTKYGNVTLSGTEVSSNTAGYAGGGLAAYSFDGNVSLVDSTISNNAVTGGGPQNRAFAGRGGALDELRLATRDGSPWETLGGGPGRPTGYSGGAGIYALYGDIEIIRSTISGNSADLGAGVVAYGNQGSVLVESSTLSGNSAGFFGGAAILRAKYDLQVRNSTISGNSAGNINGGLVIYSNLGPSGPGAAGDGSGDERGTPPRTVSIEFTTITGNSASDIGGIGISSDISIPINGTVIAGNFASTDPDIGFEPGSFAQADMDFSLVGINSTSGTLNFDTASSSLVGQDPLLGPLGDNGGPTLTHLPADGSPLLDAIPTGSAGCGGAFIDDQRGSARPVNGACDIGAVERGVIAPPPPAVAVPVMDRIGLLLMAGLLGLAGLFGFRRRSSLDG